MIQLPHNISFFLKKNITKADKNQTKLASKLPCSTSLAPSHFAFIFIFLRLEPFILRQYEKAHPNSPWRRARELNYYSLRCPQSSMPKPKP